MPSRAVMQDRSTEGRANPSLAPCECSENRAELHSSSDDVYAVGSLPRLEKGVWVWLHIPMELVALKKVLAGEILDGTDTEGENIVKAVRICEP